MQLTRLLLPLAAAVAVMGQTSPTSTRTTYLPPIGLASSETAQINVANLATTPTAGVAASCTGSIAFVNGSGATLGTAAPFTVASGQTFSAPLPYATTAASGRTVVRGVVSLSITSAPLAPCSLAISLETFDTATGVTHAFVPLEASFSVGRLR